MKDTTFKAGMALISKIFGARIDDEILHAYWNLLKQYDDEQFFTMQSRILATFIPSAQCPFPTIAHFLKSAGLEGETRTKLAIMAVKRNAYPYRSISFGDPALHETINRFGGWVAVCNWTLDDWRFNEKNFGLCYESALISNNGPTRLMGIIEQENSGKTFEPEQIKYVEEGNRTALVTWAGFDESTIRIESKGENNIPSIENLTKNIGNIE